MGGRAAGKLERLIAPGGVSQTSPLKGFLGREALAFRRMRVSNGKERCK